MFANAFLLVQVLKLKNAMREYDNDRWRIISTKVGSGFSPAACKEKAAEFEEGDSVEPEGGETQTTNPLGEESGYRQDDNSYGQEDNPYRSETTAYRSENNTYRTDDNSYGTTMTSTHPESSTSELAPMLQPY